MTETEPIALDQEALEELANEYSGTGTWVREVYDGTDEWHRSIEYDGEVHYLGCGYAIAAQTRVEDVETDLSAVPDGDLCEGCEVFHDRE